MHSTRPVTNINSKLLEMLKMGVVTSAIFISVDFHNKSSMIDMLFSYLFIVFFTHFYIPYYKINDIFGTEAKQCSNMFII